MYAAGLTNDLTAVTGQAYSKRRLVLAKFAGKTNLDLMRSIRPRIIITLLLFLEEAIRDSLEKRRSSIVRTFVRSFVHKILGKRTDGLSSLTEM